MTSTMDDAEFSERLQEVLEAFNDERDDFDRLMDGMTVDCTKEQWQSVLHTLESERKRLEQLAKDAKDRVAKLPSFLPGREELAVPGTVWLVFHNEADYSSALHFVDACETQRGAVDAAEADALQWAQATNRRSKTPGWRDRWTQAATQFCPCPLLDCGHEQWTRKLRSGVTYTIQTWSTNDGKWRATGGATRDDDTATAV